MVDDDQVVEVCAGCLCASCWQGVFMCRQSMVSGTVRKTVAELRDLSLEDESYWEDELW